MACANGYDCPDAPHGVCCGEWDGGPIDPDDAKFVIEFMENHTGVQFGDMIGLRDKERIVYAARYAVADDASR